MFFLAIDWKVCGSTEEEQYIGPFDTEQSAKEWGYQIIGDPEGLPWGVFELESPTSCVKQFKNI